MSYKEALRDMIPVTKTKEYYIYHPSCHICGESVSVLAYRPNLRYTCNTCKMIMIDKRLEEDSKALEEKRKRLKRAIKRISRVAQIADYKKAIEIIKKYMDRKGWFQSTEEIMAALELVKNNYRIHHQVKVGIYHVDFVIKSLEVVLEIDGILYHPKDLKSRNKSMRRDEFIKYKFGNDWEVIHIDDVCINTDITKLSTAIDEVLKKRKCSH